MRAIPPAGLRALIDAVRRDVPDFLFLGWTPGLAQAALAGLRGAGLDFVFYSLPWWDFRAGWLWDEAAGLRAVAPVLAAPEAPFGPRLAARWHHPASLRGAWLRALGCAAALKIRLADADGLRGRGPPPADPGIRTGEISAARAAAPPGLGAAIVAANAGRAQRAGCLGAGETRLLSGPGADVIALLRAEAADLRQGGPATLVLANVDLARPHDVPAAALLPGAGAAFGGFEDDTTRLLPGEALRLGPAEVRILQAVPATVVQRRIPPAGPAARAAAMAPRIAIEDVSPRVADGPFPVRRLLGQTVTVETDAWCPTGTMCWRWSFSGGQPGEGRNRRRTPVRPLSATPAGEPAFTPFPVGRYRLHRRGLARRIRHAVPRDPAEAGRRRRHGLAVELADAARSAP